MSHAHQWEVRYLHKTVPRLTCYRGLVDHNFTNLLLTAVRHSFVGCRGRMRSFLLQKRFQEKKKKKRNTAVIPVHIPSFYPLSGEGLGIRQAQQISASDSRPCLISNCRCDGNDIANPQRILIGFLQFGCFLLNILPEFHPHPLRLLGSCPVGAGSGHRSGAAPRDTCVHSQSAWPAPWEAAGDGLSKSADHQSGNAGLSPRLLALAQPTLGHR